MKQCDIDDDSENEKRQSPVPMALPPFFCKKKLPWTWIALVLPIVVVQESRPGSFFSPIKTYTIAHARP